MDSIPHETDTTDADGITHDEQGEAWAARTVHRIIALGTTDPEGAELLRRLVNLLAEGHTAGWVPQDFLDDGTVRRLEALRHTGLHVLVDDLEQLREDAGAGDAVEGGR